MVCTQCLCDCAVVIELILKYTKQSAHWEQKYIKSGKFCSWLIVLKFKYLDNATHFITNNMPTQFLKFYGYKCGLRQDANQTEARNKS